MALSDQTPLASGFHAKSTAMEVLNGIDLSGKTAIVTGGYSGLGLETVRALTAKGAAVIVPVRTPAKAADALASITGNVTTAPLDLGDLASVRDFTKGVIDTHDQIDILINNAGIMACPETRVGPGWESQFGVNHMGHFALTTALMPLLTKSDARVVALSSTGHKLSDIRWDDIQYDRDAYDKWQAYGQAKTANALFAPKSGRNKRLSPSVGSVNRSLRTSLRD